MLKTIVTSAILVFSSAAFAAEGGNVSASEFFFQTPGGSHDITPFAEWGSTKTEMDGSDEEEESGIRLGVEYERGLTEAISVGGQLSYISGELDDGTDTTDVVGLENIELFLKGTHAAGPGAFKYGAIFSISPGDREVDGDEINGYTGGHALEPYVGYEYNQTEQVFGAKLALEFELGDRKTDNNGTETKESGGEETVISLFYERILAAETRLGVAFDWITTADISDESGTDPDEEQLSPTHNLRVYFPTKLGGGELLPELTYGFTTADDVDGVDVDGYSNLGLRVGYRIAL